MDQILALEIAFRFGEAEGVIYPVVLMDGQDTVLVDCGYVGFLPKLEAALQRKGIEAGALTKVLITHHDHDHMGALYDLKEKYPQVEVVASEAEAPYVSGAKKSLRLEQAEAMQAALPEEQKEFGRSFIELLRRVRPVPVDVTVRGGQILPWCGGCEVVDTAGHTPGHISFYLKRHKTVVAGDAMVVEGGKPQVANPGFALDLSAASRSLEKLLRYDASRYICYHGGLYTR